MSSNTSFSEIETNNLLYRNLHIDLMLDSNHTIRCSRYEDHHWKHCTLVNEFSEHSTLDIGIEQLSLFHTPASLNLISSSQLLSKDVKFTIYILDFLWEGLALDKCSHISIDYLYRALYPIATTIESIVILSDSYCSNPDDLVDEIQMPRQYLCTEDIPQFYINRFIYNNNSVSYAPRINRVRLAPINTDNLKYIMSSSEHSMLSSFCNLPDHKLCKGHIQGVTSDLIGLPKFLTVDEDNIIDLRGLLNKELFNEKVSIEDYSTGVRESIMGKTGIVRKGLLGMTPLTSCRGVATILWDVPKHHIYLPESWLKRMKIPYRDEDRVNNLISPSYKFRNAVRGDLGVVLRCPVISTSSIQPVEIYPWNNMSIGVSVEMCEPLNLDFDGDELHIALVASSESREEIKVAISMDKDLKFSKERINSILRSEILTTDEYSNILSSGNKDEQSIYDDFMMASTCSITELSDINYTSDLFVASRCKESSRKEVVDNYMSPKHQMSVVNSSLVAISHVAKSHLTVSNGYTFARSLKLISMESMVNPKTKDWESVWTPNRGLNNVASSGLKVQYSNEKFYGCPGARLATKVTNSLIQHSLDLAKHSERISDTSMVVAFLSNSNDHVRVIGKDNNLRVERYKVSPRDKDKANVSLSRKYQSKVYMCTNRASISKLHVSNCQKCDIVTYTLCYIVRALGISHSLDELADLANSIYVSLYIDSGKKPLTGTSPANFLTYTNCSFIVKYIADNIKVVDLQKIPMKQVESFSISQQSPLQSICLGNFTNLRYRSIAKF
ncbi:hypothetical protein HK099_004575 [Clydaea vesicula]|uniref:RNA polymerase alpha subunit domain-containing protein n=1 Tax=Clydaea vesicula TaxID=447962 RepID=A0AAD5XY51_9FUNG|nr:hypothetical protein HK099_004575 [Clydaea vesicula]